MNKWDTKWLKMARTLAEDNDTCGSRKIGVVIVRDQRILGTGYNGPPSGVPHNDEKISLQRFFLPQLTDEEKKTIGDVNHFMDHFPDGGCPRKFVGAGAGVRSCLCSCQHAERNAITNATCELWDAIMYCWCGLPCIQCAGAIINSGIREVVHMNVEDYEPTSRFLFQEADVIVRSYNQQDI